jgi:hypothetical protein
MSADDINCRCDKLELLEGREAQEYARQHLTKISVDGTMWEIHYTCSHTGIQWIMDFPQSEAHGGGPPRLRKSSSKI